MEHENFPVAGFEFMDNPATLKQKEIICQLYLEKTGDILDINGTWPIPFSKWDAAHMIKALKGDEL